MATASPQANGQAERVHRVLTAMLGKLTEPVQHSNWVKMLTRVEYAINNSIHQTTTSAPGELPFGVRQRGEDVDWLGEYLDGKSCENGECNLMILRAQAIEKSQKRGEEYNAASNRPAQVFVEGEFVMIRNVDTAVGKNRKFISKYRGPYMEHKVLSNDRYVIRDIENFQMT